MDEYSNEKDSSDGEVYLKVRQYQYEGNSHLEKRWMARLSPNKSKRLRQLSSRVDIRAAFDRLLMIPSLLVQGMKIGSLARVLATNCDEEIVHALNSLLDEWSFYLSYDRVKMAKIDHQTVARLQGRAPGVSIQDAAEVQGLVLSGAVFSNFSSSERMEIWDRLKERKSIIPSLDGFFQDMWYLEACADCMKLLAAPSRDHPSVKTAFMHIFKPDRGKHECLIQVSETDFREQLGTESDRAELGYRQLWLYAKRHYPDIPRQSAGGNRVVKPKADEMALRGMAVLAQRLGFNSPQIQQLVNLSPDRQLARDVLAKARNPEFYTYNSDTFESLVTRICKCFSEAVPIDLQTSHELITSRESPLKERCGLPLHRDQKRDSQLLFLDILHNKDLPLGTKVTTLFVRRCVYFAFFGRLPDSLEPSPLGSPSFGNSFSASPLFFPHDDLPLAVAPNQTQNWRNYGSRVHDRNCREVVHQERGRRKQVRRRREQQEQRGLRVAHQLRAAECQSRMVQDTEAELESPSPGFSRPERLSESSFVDPGDLENKLQADCANGTED